MTKEEVVALVELLNRAPMTAAEKLFVQGIVNKIEYEILEREAQCLEKASVTQQA